MGAIEWLLGVGLFCIAMSKLYVGCLMIFRYSGHFEDPRDNWYISSCCFVLYLTNYNHNYGIDVLFGLWELASCFELVS